MWVADYVWAPLESFLHDATAELGLWKDWVEEEGPALGIVRGNPADQVLEHFWDELTRRQLEDPRPPWPTPALFEDGLKKYISKCAPDLAQAPRVRQLHAFKVFLEAVIPAEIQKGWGDD